MAALTQARNTIELLGPMSYEREAGSKIFAGSLAAQNAGGKAVPASDTAALTVLGRAENTAESGETVRIRTGKFIFENGASAEALAVTDIGATAYALDDQTVGKAGGTNKIKAGTVLDVTTAGVVVKING